MLKTFICLIMLATTAQFDVFKKEMAPLQSAVDASIGTTGTLVTQRSKASLIDGYGIVVTAEIAFAAPQSVTPFGVFAAANETKETVLQRRKDLQSKLSALVVERVAKMDSIGADEALTVVIHVVNTNPVNYPTLPLQMMFSAKKQATPSITFREF